MDIEKNKSTDNNAINPLEDMPSYEEHMSEHRKTFGEGVIEVFNQTKEEKNDFIDGWEEYKKRARQEREFLETLNEEQRYYQDYIFYKAIEQNPENSEFIKNIPGLDMKKPLIEQLLEKDDDGSHKVPDETIGNILEFYQTIVKKEGDKFADVSEKLQLEYESNLKNRVEHGQLPQTLLDNLVKKKQKNGGSIIDMARVYDLRPERSKDLFEPPSAAAYISHEGINNKGEINKSGESRKLLYKRVFLTPQQESKLGSFEIMLGHELTHLIAGTEASFNLLHSKTGSAGMEEWKMDYEGAITMAYREGITEAVGQMIMDNSPDASSRSLRYYFKNKAGTYLGEREFLAKLIDIDERNNKKTNKELEPLESLFLKAYAEIDKEDNVNELRERLMNIFTNWESIVEKNDFPDSDVNLLKDLGVEWQLAFADFLLDLRAKS